ncbi:MAG TPA: cation:proton antiporter [Solirubrobacter sp.]
MTWALASIAALLLAFAVGSRRLEGLDVSGAMFFTTTGLVAGPVLGLIDLQLHGEEVKLLAEVTLTLVLFADASRISLKALRREYAVPVRLLGIGLPLTIVAGGLLGGAILPAVSLPEAFVLAIVLACTDAALGQAVVSDERVPSRIRQGLNVESGLNDGLCVPLFFIALAIAETDAGEASASYAAQLVFEQIGYGLIGGVAAGALGGLALRLASGRNLIEPHWRQILSVASAFLAAGIASGLGGSIFIAAFTGGFVFGTLRADTGGEVTYLVDEGGEVFNAVTFIVFGAVILGPMLDDVTWQIALYAVLSLTVVRMLPVALAMLGTGARAPTVAFVGWFGPRGLASIVFAVILVDDAALPHLSTLLLATTVTIALSVYAHGISARPLTGRYVRWWHAHPHDARPAMESVPAAEHRLRRAAPAVWIAVDHEPATAERARERSSERPGSFR